jgi:predicted RNase H-like HicB family nuclease
MHSQGADEQEALDNIKDAIREYLEVIVQLSGEQEVREVEVEA